MKYLDAVIVIIMKEQTGKEGSAVSAFYKAWTETWRLREGKGVERGIQKDWRGLVK